MFVRTGTILDKILDQKVVEVDALRGRAEQLRQRAHEADPPRPFASALVREQVALIAEVKHASPSKGILIDPFDPRALAEIYAQNGASAISVLTDSDFFKGSLDHLMQVRAAVSLPVLRKDFTIDELQVYEGRAAGADAMLLIVAALDDQKLADLHAAVTGLGMAALVEVHDETELERALRIHARLIGVNNRDLKTFHEDLDITARLAKLVPGEVTLVAESAIRRLEDVQRMAEVGARAVLIGEGLVKSPDIAAQVRAFSSQSARRSTLS